MITQSRLPHISETKAASAGAVHKYIAMGRMENRCCDNFCQLLQISWFHIDDIEALLVGFNIPKIYPW